MEYKNIVEERLEGLSSLIESSNSVILEAHKENNKEANAKKAGKSFLNFLKKNHPDKYNQAKENPNVLKKFIAEYREWIKKHPHLYGAILSGVQLHKTVKNFAKPTSVQVIDSIVFLACEKMLRGDIDLDKEADRVARNKKRAKAAKKKAKEEEKKAKAVKEDYEYEEDGVVFLEEEYEHEEENDEILEESNEVEESEDEEAVEEEYSFEKDGFEFIEESNEVEEVEDNVLDLTE